MAAGEAVTVNLAKAIGNVRIPIVVIRISLGGISAIVAVNRSQKEPAVEAVEMIDVEEAVDAEVAIEIAVDRPVEEVVSEAEIVAEDRVAVVLDVVDPVEMVEAEGLDVAAAEEAVEGEELFLWRSCAPFRLQWKCL